jgi:hypothetical protein
LRILRLLGVLGKTLVQCRYVLTTSLLHLSLVRGERLLHFCLAGDLHKVLKL